MDIVDSRNIKERDYLQSKLMIFIDKMNRKYSKILAAPINITLGDEWQAVTDKPSECYNIINDFQTMLWDEGLDAYAGAGIGEIKTKIYSDSRMMDGPAFILAREALGIAKENIKTRNRYIYSKRNRVFLFLAEDYQQFDNKDTYFTKVDDNKLFILKQLAATAEIAASAEYTTKKPDFDFWKNDSNKKSKNIFFMTNFINLIIENNEILKGKMTPKQKTIYHKYMEQNSYRMIVKSGKEFGTIGNISQKLNSAEVFTIQRNQEMITWLLESYCSLRGEEDSES